MNNIAWIYQPHYNTDCARVACRDLLGPDKNYVVIECEGQRGVYTWDAHRASEYDIYMNGKLKCYCVPMSHLVLHKKLEDILNPETRKRIREDLLKWWKGEVKNGRAHKNELPKWLLS